MATSPSFNASFSTVPPSQPQSTQNTPTSTSTQLPPALSPSNLDTIPILTSILTRLQPPTSTIPGSSPAPSLAAANASFSSTLTSSSSSQLRPEASGPLTTKDLPQATDGLKHRLQRARAAVSSIPGIGMSIEEQEREIKRLEGRIEKQKEVLRELGEVGRSLVGGGKGDGDTVMEGTES